MKSFVYMVQGTAERMSSYFDLRERSSCDVWYLTYDVPLEDGFDKSLFYPNSTWAEGRNRLLDKVLASGTSYAYYIYLDDDIVFERGGWDAFEQRLMRYRPAIGVPVFPNTLPSLMVMRFRGRYYPLVKAQAFGFNDETLMAFSKETVEDGLVLPYVTRFDSISWWAACEIQQILIQNVYQGCILQFNDIRIANVQHGDYPNTPFRNDLNAWLDRQFHGSYVRLRKTPMCFSSYGVGTWLRGMTSTGRFRKVVSDISCLFKNTMFYRRGDCRRPDFGKFEEGSDIRMRIGR